MNLIKRKLKIDSIENNTIYKKSIYKNMKALEILKNGFMMLFLADETINVTTNDGKNFIVFSKELTVGSKIMEVASDGTQTEVASGDYQLTSGQTITVDKSVITNIAETPAPAAEEMSNDTKEELAVDAPSTDAPSTDVPSDTDRIKALEDKVNEIIDLLNSVLNNETEMKKQTEELKKQNIELKKQIDETPVGEKPEIEPKLNVSEISDLEMRKKNILDRAKQKYEIKNK